MPKIFITLTYENGDKEERFVKLNKPFKTKNGRIYKITNPTSDDLLIASLKNTLDIKEVK